jgi:hypothetical protein
MLSAHSFNLQIAVKALLVKYMLACTLLPVRVSQPEEEQFSLSTNELKVLLKFWADHLLKTTPQVLNLLTAKKVHLGGEKELL